MEKRDFKQIGVAAAALALGLVLAYKYRSKPLKRLQQVTYGEFKKLDNPVGTYLVSNVPGAVVFQAIREHVSSFTFGERKDKDETHLISTSRNVVGFPEVGLITARSQMTYHAEQLIGATLADSLNLMSMSKSYFVSGRTTYLDPAQEGKSYPKCVVVYLQPKSVVGGKVETKQGDVLISVDSEVVFSAQGGKYSMQVFEENKWGDLDLNNRDALRHIGLLQSQTIKKQYKELEQYAFVDGIHHFLFQSCGSTMTIASEFPHKTAYLTDNQILAFVALQQIQGRGQGQNEWKSPIGNLYVTFLLKTQTMPYWASLITGLTIRQTVATFGKQVDHKWINDLFFQGKKVGGILCESSNAPDGGYYLSVGVGINLTNCPEDGTKLEDISREDIFWSLGKKLAENIRLADKEGPQNMFKQMNFLYMNEQVTILDHTLTKVLYEGVFVGINEFGHAQLKQPDDSIISASQGRMRKPQI